MTNTLEAFGDTRKGIIVEVFKPAMGDCSNGGFSSYCKELTLVGPGIPEIFEASPERPAVVLKLRWGIGGKLPVLPAGTTGEATNPYVHAEPAYPVPAGERGWMFGGCAVYSSDSRFPFDYPIKLHDRAEVMEKNV